TIVIPTAVTSSSTKTDPLCSTGLGSMSVTFSGGTPGYNCSLNSGKPSPFTSSQAFNNLSAGAHNVVVTDSNGCPAAATQQTIVIPTAVTSSSTKTDPLCSTGLGSMSVTFSGGTPGYNCSLDSGTPAPCTSPQAFNNLSAGAHNVVVTDSNGCPAAATQQTIVIPTAVTSSSTKTDPDCSTGLGSMSVTFSGGTPGYNCSLDSGTPAPCTSPQAFNNLSAGPHSVVVTDSNGCPAAATEQTIVIPTAVALTLTPSDV